MNESVYDKHTNKQSHLLITERDNHDLRHSRNSELSYEKIEEKPIIVIKKNGSQQPFDIKKVERGILTCTDKLKINHEDIEKILQRIEDNVREIARNKKVVKSTEIGEETLKQLYTLSPVAYVRFASVYRAFDDLDMFIEEIEHIANQVKNS